MPIVPLLSIAPFDAAAVSLRDVAQEWERRAARAMAESGESAAKLELARRGGAKLQLTSDSMRGQVDQIIRGVAAAKPVEELSLARLAKDNSDGAGKAVANVTANAKSGRANVPAFNPKPLRDKMKATADAGRVANKRLASKVGEADKFERGLVARKSL